jgi:hypothetical protein
METLQELQRQARELGLEGFRGRHDCPFLVKHPKALAPSSESVDFDYATRTVNLNQDPLADQMQVMMVRKNPQNPFPDRLTIGRAPNCDIVLRLTFVSKVHAHLFTQTEGQLVLRDNNASNGTYVNHRKLEPAASRRVELGDVLSFGFLDLELVDAARLYDIVKSPPRAVGTR